MHLSTLLNIFVVIFIITTVSVGQTIAQDINNNNGGCRLPSAFNSDHSFSICSSTKPLKPKWIKQIEKKFCRANWEICDTSIHLDPNQLFFSDNIDKNDKNVAAVTNDYSEYSVYKKKTKKTSRNNIPKGCYALFPNGSNKKPIGYGTHCHINLYFDGVLCCQKTKRLENSPQITTSDRNSFLQYLDEPRFKTLSPPKKLWNKDYNEKQSYNDKNTYYKNFVLFNEI